MHLPVHGKEKSSLSISILRLDQGKGMKGVEIMLSLAPPTPVGSTPLANPFLLPSLPPLNPQPSAVNLGAALGREGLMKPSSFRPPGSDSSYLQSKELSKEVIRL